MAMAVEAVAGRELVEVAGSSDPLSRRAEQLLTVLHRVIPYDGAWLALADPVHPAYTGVASVNLSESVLRFLDGPRQARDMEETGADRQVRPWSPSDLPFPVDELPGWAECLIPAGYRGGMAMALFGDGGRRVGFLGMPWAGSRPPLPQTRQWLTEVARVLGRGVDPLRSRSAIAGLVHDARARVMVHRDGAVAPMPGLAEDPLLASDGPMLAVARTELAAGRVHSSFLWPKGGPACAARAHPGHRHVCSRALPDPADRHRSVGAAEGPAGLTPRELEILGLLAEGSSNAEIARALVVAPRTVAAHLEHILVKMDAPTRTPAAVRAQRSGHHVPWRSPMNGRTERVAHLRLDLAAAGASAATLQVRAGEMLRALNAVVANDAGWLALRDPERHRHIPLATTGQAEPLRRYFERLDAEAEVEELGLNSRRPPLLASEIPVPLPEVAAWADHLLPAGLRGGLAAGLFTTAGRHLGFLSLLTEEPFQLGDPERRIIAAVTRVIADGLDRTLQMAESARIVVAARAGVVLTRGGGTLPLPGMPGDQLLASGSPVLVTVADELATTLTYVSFLVPVPHGGPDHVRAGHGAELCGARVGPPRRCRAAVPAGRPARPGAVQPADARTAGGGDH